MKRLILLAMAVFLITACGPQPSADDCKITTENLSAAIDSAVENKEFYQSSVDLRKSAMHLLASLFGFNAEDLEKPMPETPIVVIPPKSNLGDQCTNAEINLAFIATDVALNASQKYLTAAEVEIAIAGAISDMTEREKLSLETYNAEIEKAIGSVP